MLFTDAMAVRRVLLILVAQCVVLGCSLGAWPLKTRADTKFVDDYIKYQTMTCAGTDMHQTVQLAWRLLILVSTFVLAWLTRNVFSEFNDSSPIMRGLLMLMCIMLVRRAARSSARMPIRRRRVLIGVYFPPCTNRRW